MDRPAAIAALEAQLGYCFQDRQHLEVALTHASMLGLGKAIVHNERLEFLGDRVLALVIARQLFAAYPDSDEGELSKRLSRAVDKHTCAEVARAIGLPQVLRSAAGSTRKPSTASDTIVGDACEALLAALYLDGGLEAAEGAILRLWQDNLSAPFMPSSNPKAMLQEWLAAKGKPLPVYRIVDRIGPAHAPLFTIEVSAQGLDPITAQGQSRQAAEKSAALALLQREGIS